MCVLKERLSNSQSGGQTYLPCSPRGTHGTERRVTPDADFRGATVLCGGGEAPWPLSDVEVPTLLHGLVHLPCLCWHVLGWGWHGCMGVGASGGCDFVCLLQLSRGASGDHPPGDRYPVLADLWRLSTKIPVLS